jgi:hypothetical protein
MAAMALTNALRIKKTRRSIPDGASCVIRLSMEEVSASFPLASESGLSDLFDMLDTFLSGDNVACSTTSTAHPRCRCDRQGGMRCNNADATLN